MSEKGARTGHCPVCGVHIGAELVACPRCETQHHPDCWEFAGGCAIYGCAPPVITRTAIAVCGTLLEERPGAAPADQLVISTKTGRYWIDPLPGPLSPYWWAAAAALAPLGGIGFLILPGLPHLLSRVRWRFDVLGRFFEYSVAALGIPLRRRRIPLDDIVRLEIRDDEVHIRLVMVLSDGTSLELSPSVEDDPLAWRRLRAVARGVQLHAGVHVTSALRMDPESCEKRLVALKSRFDQVAGRAQLLAGVSTATAGALAGLMLMSGIGWPAALAVVLGARLSRAQDESGPDSRFLRDGLLRPSALPELERQVHALSVSRRGSVAYVAGSALLLASAALWSGTLGAPIAFTVAALGSILGTASWSRARALKKLIREAEMGKDELAPDRVALLIGDAVVEVRRGMLAEHTRQRIAELRWELETRKSGDFHGFVTIFSAIAFLFANSVRGTVATVVAMIAAVIALHGVFLAANFARWKAAGRPLGELEGELEELLKERRLLASGPRPPELSAATPQKEGKPEKGGDKEPEGEGGSSPASPPEA